MGVAAIYIASEGRPLDTRIVGLDSALLLAEEILRIVGLSEKDAHLTAEHLVASEIRGYPSHGLARLAQIAELPSTVGCYSINLTKIEKPGFLLFDGQGRLGIPAVTEAIDNARMKLNEYAAVVFGISGYLGTTGSLGVYGSDLSGHGIVSILMCNSGAVVAPHGSIERILGTNPIAISIPGSQAPFVADVATAAWSYGAIRHAALAGTSLPPYVVQTAEGTPSTDPLDADRGTLLPMAGHKGYVLGLAVELLSGPLIGAKAGRQAVSGSDGFLGVLIRVDAARAPELVNADIERLFDEIRGGPVAPGHTKIRIPGEASHRRRREGTHLELPTKLIEELERLRTTCAAGRAAG